MNMTWNVIGSIIYSFTQWLLLIVIAKLGTPEMVGYYALGLAVTAPIVLFTDMKLRLALVTDTKNVYLFDNYLGARVLSVGVALFIIILVIIIFGYEFHTAIILLLVGIAKLPESVSDIFHGQLQKYERMDLITISNVMKGIGTVIVFFVLLLLTNNLIWALVGQILTWVMVLLFFDYLVVKGLFQSVQIDFQWSKLKSLFHLSIPLGLMALLTSFNTNIPNYFVEYFIGTEELGYLAALLYILFAGNRLVDSLRQPAATRLATLFEQNRLKEYQKLLLLLVTIGFLMAVVGIGVTIVLGELLLTIIYTNEYTAYSQLFIYIMGAGIFSFPAMFLDTGLIATRNFKLQPYLAAIWVIGSLIGCYIFIPKYGLDGAAYAIILASFLKFISLVIALFIILKIKTLAKYIRYL
ncbi:oligosaccharide flippase family protein [Ornithinibacillus halotolerans]|uniref:Polysaccharide biosynthesis protein n=1 Tax=Ornithinibacillus halotolerans TaxID=1274357 RepID=A0A916RVE0_9BACI|nr:oligosaccharide flippase family protein [Ornithinibacillus halotolerans]GGA72931.1 hypothetical protein GCM10008025_15900 [Ornithinibacillus halotolerans]